MKPEKLPIFISWSGKLAQKFAEAYKSSIINLVGDYVEPFFSKDIPAGEKWHQEILRKLSQSKVGIVILTPDSLKSSWVQYEAGALDMALFEEPKNFFPLLVGVNNSAEALEKSPIKYHMCKTFASDDNHGTIQFLKQIIEKVLKNKKIDCNDEWNDKIIEEAQSLHDKLKSAFDEWNNGFKTHLPEIELVDYQEHTNQFSSFVNDYIAFNAPLVYEELGQNKTALNEHIDRYREYKTRAEYFYPIFAILKEQTLLQWLHSIHGFFTRLNDSLNEQENSLLTFYAPDFTANVDEGKVSFIPKFRYDIGFTFFLGEKSDDSSLVYIYMHNRIYSALADTKEPIVKKYFIIRKPDDFKLHERFITESQFRSMRGMKSMNLSEFLAYCEKLMSALEQYL